MSRTRRRRCLQRCYGWLLCKTRSSAPSVVVCCWQRCIKYREVFHSKYRIKKQRIAMLRGPYIGDIYSCYLGVSEAAGKRKSGGDGLAPACSLVQAFCSVEIPFCYSIRCCGSSSVIITYIYICKFALKIYLKFLASLSRPINHRSRSLLHA